MRIKDKDVYTYLIRFFNDNIELMPKELVEKAYNIDIIKNNFSKNSIYLNYIYFRRLIRTGERSRGFSDILYDISLNYLDDNKNNNNIRYVENLTYEDIQQEYEAQKIKIIDKYSNFIESNKNKIQILNKMNDELKGYMDNKLQQLYIEYIKNVEKIFEKIGE